MDRSPEVAIRENDFVIERNVNKVHVLAPMYTVQYVGWEGEDAGRMEGR